MEYRHLPSGNTIIGCIVLMGISVIFLFVLSSLGKTDIEQNHMMVVPKIGTVEYEEYMEQFFEKYGREWNKQDQMIALKNGLHIQIGLLGYIFSIPIIYFHIYDWYWWFKDRKKYIEGEVEEEPQSLKNQLIGTIIIVCIVILFGGYLWLIAPYMIEPIA